MHTVKLYSGSELNRNFKLEVVFFFYYFKLLNSLMCNTRSYFLRQMIRYLVCKILI